MTEIFNYSCHRTVNYFALERAYKAFRLKPLEPLVRLSLLIPKEYLRFNNPPCRWIHFSILGHITAQTAGVRGEGFLEKQRNSYF